MNYKFKHTWILIAFIVDLLKPVNVQFAMPMYPAPPPPIYHMPPSICPMPMPVPLLPIAIPGRGSEDMTSSNKKTTAKTTTTTKKPETIAVAVPMPVPVPMPMPMPMAVAMGVPALPPNSHQRPTQKPKNCPPCPPCVCSPSCTPSFFSYCSPCHLKCRCKNKEDAPEPLPYRPTQAPYRPAQAPAYGVPVPIPAVMPPPVVMVPYPPPIPVQTRQDRYRPRKEQKPKYSSCSDDSTESTSSESDYILRKRKYKKRKRFGGHRRSFRSSDSDNEVVKPMLSYIAENGEVKFKTKISSDDVAELLGEKKDLNKNYHTVHVMTDENENSKPKVLVVSHKSANRKPKRYKKVLLREGVANHVLGDGKKELIFRPPGNKKISNLSVSFQIS